MQAQPVVPISLSVLLIHPLSLSCLLPLFVNPKQRERRALVSENPIRFEIIGGVQTRELRQPLLGRNTQSSSMSTQDHRTQPLRYSRSLRKRKTGLNVDLNSAPPSENRDQVGTSTRSRHQDCREDLAPPVAIDLEAFDDDVVISSPRAFAAAKNNSRRNHGRAIVVDVDSEERSSRMAQNSRSKRRRVSVDQVYINLEVSSNSMRDDANSMVPPPPPPPKELTFNCPVCMGPLVEEMSTKCGHIFCKACIKTAIAAQSKCPTCRRRVTAKDIIRVYLPVASCS